LSSSSGPSPSSSVFELFLVPLPTAALAEVCFSYCFANVCTLVYMYMYVCMYVYIYMYVYILI
jgi:hypothetical protein